MAALTDRFARAVDYARVAHAAQFRKGSNIPYNYYLLGVSSLVIEFGGNEDQAIAGLLHDTLEDCGAAHRGAARAYLRALEELSGCKLSLVATGAGREDTIVLDDPIASAAGKA